MEDFVTNLLRADKFNFEVENLSEYTLVPRHCFNYELEFFTSASGWIIMDNRYIECKKNEINFRKPNEVATGVPPYSGYIICFSMKSKRPYTKAIFGNEETKEELQEDTILGKMPTIICPNNPKEIEKMLENIINLFGSNKALNRYQANIILNQLLLNLLTQCENRAVEIHNPKILKVKNYIDENYLKEISIKEIIGKSNLSKAYFHQCFKQITGTSPNNYIINLRLVKAKNLLATSSMKICDIALECGYLDSVYFSSLFKKHVGKTPSQYRKSTYTAHH